MEDIFFERPYDKGPLLRNIFDQEHLHCRTFFRGSKSANCSSRKRSKGHSCLLPLEFDFHVNIIHRKLNINPVCLIHNASVSLSRITKKNLTPTHLTRECI